MNAPRKHLTPSDIDAVIDDESIQGVEGTQITLCVLTLRNGARVVGTNYGSIDPARQDWAKGAQMAKADAVAKVWALEGYALRERLVAAPVVSGGVPWIVLVEGDPATLPAPGFWLVTVDTDSGREVHVLEHKGKGKWLHEGEFTFQHGYYFRPIAWAPRPEAYAGEVPE